MTRFHLVLFMLILAFSSMAQTDTTVHLNTAHGDTSYHPKKEILLDGKRFRVYNNWMNLGLGEGFNSNLATPQNILDVDLHFHIYKHYFQVGTFLSGDRFGSFNTYSTHVAYGKRSENQHRNMFICIGPSYSWGYPFKQGIYLPNIYSVFGVYGQAQYIYKLAYDLGIGGALFADANSRQTVYGISLALYFSGAYRGEKKKSASWND